MDSGGVLHSHPELRNLVVGASTGLRVDLIRASAPRVGILTGFRLREVCRVVETLLQDVITVGGERGVGRWKIVNS